MHFPSVRRWTATIQYNLYRSTFKRVLLGYTEHGKINDTSYHGSSDPGSSNDKIKIKVGSSSDYSIDLSLSFQQTRAFTDINRVILSSAGCSSIGSAIYFLFKLLGWDKEIRAIGGISYNCYPIIAALLNSSYYSLVDLNVEYGFIIGQLPLICPLLSSREYNYLCPISACNARAIVTNNPNISPLLTDALIGPVQYGDTAILLTDVIRSIEDEFRLLQAYRTCVKLGNLKIPYIVTLVDGHPLMYNSYQQSQLLDKAQDNKSWIYNSILFERHIAVKSQFKKCTYYAPFEQDNPFYKLVLENRRIPNNRPKIVPIFSLDQLYEIEVLNNDSN